MLNVELNLSHGPQNLLTMKTLNHGRRKGPPRPRTGGGSQLGGGAHNFTPTWIRLGIYKLAGVLWWGCLKGTGGCPTAQSVTLRELEERLGIARSTINSIISEYV